MSKRKNITHLLPQIIERDGGEWKCHYCGCNLIPPWVTDDVEPYCVFTMSEAMPPQTMGDCDGKYTYEEVIRATEQASMGNLKYWICGWEIAPGYDVPVVDHKHPRSKGGSDHIDNLLAACWHCNQAKRDKTYEEYVKLLAVNHGS